MTSCEQFEELLADALGDELSPEDRRTFEDHLAVCERCRNDYESSRDAVGAMQNLPAPQQVDVRREGDRLVIENNRANRSLDASGLEQSPRSKVNPLARLAGRTLRYAASALVAFTAGYVAHGWQAAPAGPPPGMGIVKQIDAVPGSVTGGDLQQALVSAHLRGPRRSDLAKCLIAVSTTDG